ncbi:MAG: acetolactate synthase large subunit [Pseudomonadota bacterium]
MAKSSAAPDQKTKEAYFTASQSQLIWARFKRNRTAMTAASVLVFLILIGLFAPFLSPYNPTIAGRDAEYQNGAPQIPKFCDDKGLSWPVSHWVKTSGSPAEVGADGAEAVAAAMVAPGQIATLILPGDTAWDPGGEVAAKAETPTRLAVDPAAIEAAAAHLGGPESLIILGGAALLAENVEMAGRISAKTGCGLLTEWSNAKLERGAGRVSVNRIPYPVEQALEVLAPYKRIVLVGSRRPVAFFAYPNKPGILTADDVEFVEMCDWGADMTAGLAALADAVGATDTPPAGVAEAMRPDVPDGPLTPDSIARVLGNLIPENAIVVDESVTTGRQFFSQTAGAPHHTWLNNRGGSIGYGLPCAIGAAIACPDRKVLALEGDGSAMYTVQGLWTIAREELDITVLVFANHSYRILHGELRNVGVENPGPRAQDMLTLNRPDLDWVDMARGMGVEGEKVTDTQALFRALEEGLERSGPYLVQVEL